MSANPEMERLFEYQKEMRSRIDNTPHIEKYRYVGGADLTAKDDIFVGCFVVVDCDNDLKVVYSKCTEMKVDVPYYSGLLCFREGPVVVSLYHEFCMSCPDIKLDVILTDGSGEWHPRGFGLSCYVGVELQIPTIGVFKNFLNIGSGDDRKTVVQRAKESCAKVGDVIILHHDFVDEGFSASCAVMRTTPNVPFNPIFLSPGNLIDLDSSINIVRRLCIHREPEPLRLADRISREYVRKKQGSAQ